MDNDKRLPLPNAADTARPLVTANLSVEELLDNFRLRQKMGLIPDRVVQLEPSQEDILRLYSESVRAYEELYAPYSRSVKSLRHIPSFSGDRNDRRITSPTAGSDRSAVGAGPSSPSSSHDESRNSGNEQQRGRSDSAELPGLYAELNTVRRDKAALEQQVRNYSHCAQLCRHADSVWSGEFPY